jgi:hypothetical protein
MPWELGAFADFAADKAGGAGDEEGGHRGKWESMKVGK